MSNMPIILYTLLVLVHRHKESCSNKLRGCIKPSAHQSSGEPQGFSMGHGDVLRALPTCICSLRSFESIREFEFVKN